MNDMNRAQRRRLARAIAKGQVAAAPQQQPQLPDHLAPAFIAAKEAENQLVQLRQIRTTLEEAKEAFARYEELVPKDARDADYADLYSDFNATYADALKNQGAACLDFVEAVGLFEEARLAPPSPIIDPNTGDAAVPSGPGVLIPVSS
jgi:hypothetical protein